MVNIITTPNGEKIIIETEDNKPVSKVKVTISINNETVSKTVTFRKDK